MSFVIKYTPTGHYFNITGRGLDPLNIGLIAKIYKTEQDALKDFAEIEHYMGRMQGVCAHADIGLTVFGKPKWYEERHTKKLTARQQAKLDWYENAVRIKKERCQFAKNLKLSDAIIEEYKG